MAPRREEALWAMPPAFAEYPDSFSAPERGRRAPNLFIVGEIAPAQGCAKSAVAGRRLALAGGSAATNADGERWRDG